MTRETEKSDGTGFNWVVFSDSSMAKETVSTRLPVAIAEQVDRYADTHEISRTEAMELFIRQGLESPTAHREERTYTGQIRADWTPAPPHEDPDYGWSGSDGVATRVQRKLGNTAPRTGEYEESVARSSRLPGEVVRGIEDWAESQDMNKANAAADLLERGLLADPLPPDHTVSLEGEPYTVTLEPEKADTFRRFRLMKRQTPSEAVSALLGATRSQKPIRPEWEKPEDGEE